MDTTYVATLMTTIVPDTDSSPFDFTDEAEDPELIGSWRNDEWHYHGVVVTATVATMVNGKPFTAEASESLWGVDDVDPTYLDVVAAELATELRSRLERDYPGIVFAA